MDLFRKGTASQKIPLPGDYVVLQVDMNFQNESFLWGLLQDAVRSKERVIMGFPDPKSGVLVEKHTKFGDKIISAPVDDPLMRHLGETFLSKDLQMRIYGELVGGEVTSRFDDLTVIYLMPGMADPKTVVHELLGHFYLASRGAPTRHSDSLEGRAVSDVSGKFYDKSVTDFITQVEALSKCK